MKLLEEADIPDELPKWHSYSETCSGPIHASAIFRTMPIMLCCVQMIFFYSECDSLVHNYNKYELARMALWHHFV